MNNQKKYKIIIIGGGASSMTAAISALDADRSLAGNILILESNDRVGKKILATGNGRCNFTNENMTPDAYYTDDRERLEDILTQFPAKAAVSFFKKLGMLAENKNGYFYPASETASTVLDVLRLRLEELGCGILCHISVIKLRKEENGGYLIEAAVKESGGYLAEAAAKEGGDSSVRFYADNIILASGSRAGGFIKDKNADPLEPVKDFGLSVAPLYPALTKCICKENFYKGIAGVRVHAGLSLYEMGHEGKRFLRYEEGELQLTKEGISGIVVFQMSGDIAQKLAEKRRLFVEIDFLPDFQVENTERWVEERLRMLPERSPEDFFLGILHKKLLFACLQREKIKASDKSWGISLSDSRRQEKIREMAIRVLERAMHFTTEVTAVSGMEQAQVCRGGICLSELNEKMESRKLPGFFACGEVLNVDGQCGGYNLHFAWASGHLAGIHAAKRASSGKN